MQLDSLDRKLLYELDQNSRISYADLAKRVKHGSDIVRYRVERLISEKIIEKCSALWDVRRFGMTIYKSYLKLRPDQAKIAALVSKLDRSTRVYWVAECYGRWDFIFSVVASDPREFLEIEERLLHQFSDLILERQLFTIIELNRYPRNYLVQKLSKIFYQGAEPAQIELSEIDKKILLALVENARLSWVELADRLDITPAIAKYRTERLEEQKVIAGYRVQINCENLGVMFFKVLISLPNHAAAARLKEICQKKHHITLFVKQLGGWLFEFEAEVYDFIGFNKLIDEIREELHDQINSLEYLMIRKDHYHRASL